MRFLSIVLTIVFISVAFADLPDGTTFHCAGGNKPSKNDSFSLLTTFTVQVIADAPIAKSEWEIGIAHDVENKNISTMVTAFTNGTLSEWIFNYTAGNCSYIKMDGSCTNTNLTDGDCANANPFNIGASFLNEKEMPPRTIQELAKWAQESFQYVYLDKDDVHMVHGIEADHYISCRNVSKDDKMERWIEVEFCFPKNDDKLNPKGVPMMVEFKSYERNASDPASNKTNDFVRFNFVHAKNSISKRAATDYFTPPPGAICPNGVEKAMPTLPDRFQAHIEHIDLNKKKVDTSEFYYDKNQSMVGILYSQENEDEPFTQKIIASKPAGNFFVLQDFGTGLQYQLNVDDRTCAAPVKIPDDAGDVQKTDVLSMKPSELAMLANVPKQNYTYIGQRFFMNILADVWAVKTDERAYEVYFTNGWKMDSGMSDDTASVPLAILTYDLTGKTIKFEPRHPYEFFKRPPLLEGHVHGFKTFQQQDSPSPVLLALVEKNLDVSRCLAPAAGAKEPNFLATQIIVNDEKGTLSDLYKAGISDATLKIRSQLAKLAGVRPVRVGELSFETTGEKEMTLFFTILPKATGGAKVVPLPDNKTEDAVKMLNETLRDNPKEIQIKDGLKIILKSEVKTVTDYISHPPPAPTIVKSGYSGGSMAAMGIIMLLIGVGGGIGGGWYLWKRNRGIAYQVYE